MVEKQNTLAEIQTSHLYMNKSIVLNQLSYHDLLGLVRFRLGPIMLEGANSKLIQNFPQYTNTDVK